VTAGSGVTANFGWTLFQRRDRQARAGQVVGSDSTDTGSHSWPQVSQ